MDSFFDKEFRLEELERCGDPLTKLNELIPWEEFRPELEALRKSEGERKSPAGRKPFDVVLMFKIMILQSLYNLSDAAVEFQVKDRLSFMRFLNLSLADRVPDEKTVWAFREQLGRLGLESKLFDQFDSYLRTHGFSAKKGQIVDASIIAAPKQRNTRDENKEIKDGFEPDGWNEAKRRQKDIDARWTKKNGVSHFGYKNHIQIDAGSKFIRDFSVTDASVHDSQVFESLLDQENSSRDVLADSAYRSKKSEESLEAKGFRPRLQHKGCKNKPLSERELQGNRTRSRIRSRIEHVFGIQAMRAGDLVIRTIGLARAKVKIGLRNLAYNLDRYASFMRIRRIEAEMAA